MIGTLQLYSRWETARAASAAPAAQASALNGATQQSAGAIVPAPTPVPLDSASARRDSMRAQRAADSVAATQAIERPIADFVAAFRDRDVAKIKAVYREMPEKQQSALESLFRNADKVAAQPVFGHIEKNGNTARVPFKANLVITQHGVRVNSTLPYDATLEQHDSKWTIVSLKAVENTP